MEDVLALIWIIYIAMSVASLNPCCNGRCTRTVKGKAWQTNNFKS